MDLKINEGLIFRNKSDNEKAPLFTGQVNVDGQNWDIALWPREGNDGKKFYSVRISEPYNKGGKGKPAGKSQGELKPKPKPRREEEDEDLFG